MGAKSDVTFAGRDSIVHLALEGCATPVRARSHRNPAPKVGTRVRVRVPGEVAFFSGPAADTRGWEAKDASDPVASGLR